MSRSGILLALVGCAGCALPGANEIAGQPVNSCNEDSDCGSLGACAAGRCVATSYDLGGLLLEVRVDPAWSFAPGASFVVDPGALGLHLVSDGTRDEPLGTRFDIGLPAPISITSGQVVLDAPVAGCGPVNMPVASNVTFFRAPKLAGLPLDVVAATMSAGTASTPPSFAVDLVSGPDDLYDVYIQPVPVMGCPLAPTLIPAQSITEGTTLFQLPAPGSLSGSIDTGSSAGWSLDVAEPERGLEISAPGSSLVGSRASARFSPLLDPTASPILRLTSTSSAPSDALNVFWSLAGAATTGTPLKPVVSLMADLPAAVPVPGTVRGSTTGGPLEAEILAQSTVIASDDVGYNATVSALTTSQATSGAFTLDLLPGTYTLRVNPRDDATFGARDVSIVVPLTTPLRIDLDPMIRWSGSVRTATGGPLTATPVEAAPSQAPARSFLAATHALSPLTSRQVFTSTDGGGGFSLLVDQGLADLVVQPDPATNYPWLVVPGAMPTAVSMSLQLTTPAFLDGILTDPTGAPIAGAEIDAWFPVRDPSSPTGLTGTVVRIATTSTDSNGAYTLVLPSSL